MSYNLGYEDSLTIETGKMSEPTDLDDKPFGVLTPSYYDFPNGVQVRDISAHLTSFGGQALQYVARATRLDGNNKGEAVKDLQKALDFIQWEIDRLEAGNE